MAQGKETAALVLSLAITGAIVGGGVWWVMSGSKSSGPGETGSNPAATPSNPAATNRETVAISTGDRLITSVTTPDKQAAVAAIAQGDFTAAVPRLEASLQTTPNDPEALIYLNNARIGTDASYTVAIAIPAGTNADAAQELLRGAAQAQAEINQAGGVNGTLLKVAIVNDNNDPALASQVAQALVDRPEVLGVVGHFGSDTSEAAAQVYQAAGLVMISPTSTATPLASLGNFIFRTVPNDAATGKALARYQVEQLQTQNTVVFYNSQSDYSNSLKQEFSNELVFENGQIVGEYDLSSGIDPTQALSEAQQQGAQAIALLPNSETLDPALQVVQANGRRLPILAGDSVYNFTTLETAGANGVGITLAVPWQSQQGNGETFAAAARELWGGDVNWRTAMAYDAVQVFQAALQQNPTRAGVQSAIAAQSFQATGASGAIRFVQSGDRNQAAQLVTIAPGNRSGTGYDFVPLSP
jgi:branched-chain amino acid transport system substrate-binding protein